MVLDSATTAQTGYTGATTDSTLLGRSGIAATQLRPSGAVQFGDRRVDVVTAGGFVEAGTPVRVVEVRGNRIVVEPESTLSGAS